MINTSGMQSNNLSALLIGRRDLDKKGIRFIDGSGEEDFLSYSDLYAAALKGLSFLQKNGLQPKDELVFQIGDNRNFIIAFWACILGGIVPVPLTVGQNDEHKQKLFNIWPVLNNPFLLSSTGNWDRLRDYAGANGLAVPGSRMADRLVEESGLINARENGAIREINENDLAFIQFSSGSTGNPKGVTLTHKNLLSNMEAISSKAQYTADDAMLSWMPLTHDMGLIGFHLNPLYAGIDQYLIPTQVFIRRPVLWMEKASEHRISILSSPNFGYKYFIKYFDPAGKYDWDLRSVRIIYNGAEPISEQLCHDMAAHLSKFGLDRNAIRPVYGLAEATLAVTMSNLNEEIISLELDRDRLNFGDTLSIAENRGRTVPIVNVGQPILHCSVRITDHSNLILEDRRIGNIQIKGEAVTAGYYNNPEETGRILADDGWLQTGDLGFMDKGSLYITGRAKDIIFLQGQNYYPHDIERVAEEVAGIELNKIAVVGIPDAALHKDEIIAFVFYRGELPDFIPLAMALRSHINEKIGFRIDRAIPVKDIPRTTSGKLQRFRLQERYRKGEYDDTLRQMEPMISAYHAALAPADAANTDTERALLTIWEKILKTSGIGTRQKFFEIGGDSLLAAELGMLIWAEFHTELPASAIYANQTITELAREIDSREKKVYSPIPRAISRDHYPVSPAQKGMYYAWQQDKGSLAYNMPVAFRVNGQIDTGMVQTCLERLILRHDTLRMSFHLSGNVYFRVHDTAALRLETISCSRTGMEESLKAAILPFDLEQPPLMRCMLIHVTGENAILLIDFHHIIADGISIIHFMDEWIDLYKGNTLRALPVQFPDHICWEGANTRPGKMADQQRFWKSRLAMELPVLELPLDYPRPAIFNTRGGKIAFTLGGDARQGLINLAKDNQCTLHAVMLSGYALLLSKYTGQQDILVGIPVAGRRHPDLAAMQGMFVNNLVIGAAIDPAGSFIQLLDRMQGSLRPAMDNQDYPFYELVEDLHGKRDVSRNPIFDTMFIFQNMVLPALQTADFGLTRYSFDPGFSKFDLSMEVFDDAGAIRYALEYAESLFTKDTILQMGGHFGNLIDRILADPSAPVADISVLSGPEEKKYIRDYNAAEYPYPSDKTLDQLFFLQAQRTPDHIAIEYKGETISYRQLNSAANGLAERLVEKGIGPDAVVGVLLERSPSLIIGILAILKAGGCYLPMDTDLPDERLAFLVADSRCKLLIGSRQSLARNIQLDPAVTACIDIDEPAPAAGQTSYENNGSGRSRSLAYIIYTSGTTGRPKGVMIEHRSAVNYIDWAIRNYIKEPVAAFPLFTSISFDLTVTSIFAPLLSGNTIVIYREEPNEVLIERIMADDRVDIIKLTPSHLKIIAAGGPIPVRGHRIKRMIVGGEQLETRLAKNIYEKFHGDIEIINEYGPTEATVGCMIHRFRADERLPNVPIGIPADNTQIYILDASHKPVPGGVKGELYIGGDGIARGYLFNKELTDLKFMANPFATGSLYRTGDIARWLPGGIIAYIGRNDQQVKINGYRIELSEIESQILGHENITDVLVVARSIREDKTLLYAYYRAGTRLKTDDLRNYLAGRLPYYMIPVHFIQLEKIPLTTNGKVDHSLLPDPAAEITIDRAPMNRVEESLLQIGREILGEPDMSMTDNFFELGGDSIKAVQMAARALDKGISVRVRDILTYHTIAQISLSAEQKTTASPYQQGLAAGDRGLTPIEKWFFGRAFKEPGFFNQSVLLRLNKEMDFSTLERSLARLIMHHDGLRMNHDPERNGMFYNDAHSRTPLTLQQHFLEGPDKEPALIRLCERIKNTFDITKSLLVKAAWIREADGSSILLITAHHLLVDGLSWRILLEDLYHIYRSFEKGEEAVLPAKTATQIDWYRKLQDHAAAGLAKQEEEYWRRMEDTGSFIPYDAETTDWRMVNSCKIIRTLDKEDTHFLLTAAHRTYGTDLLILLNTAWVMTLKEWTGLDHVVIWQESHGRLLEDVDVSRTAGWFTAMYPLRFECTEGPLASQLMEVKEKIRNLPHHGLNDGIRRYAGGSLPAGEKDLVDLRLNYLGQFGRELNNDLFSYTGESGGPDCSPENDMTAKIDLNIMVLDGSLRMELNYNNRAHKGSTMDRIADTFINNLHRLLMHIRGEGEIHFTPSDFDLVDLDQEELNGLFK